MKHRIWDIPTRLFHWILACLVVVCLYTGTTGGFEEMDYHMLSGYGVLALILFRIVWGVIGGAYSRFRTFIKPMEILPYARQITQQPGIQSPGHNPLGGLSVLAILVSLLLQASTGLFATDDIFIEGPLMHLVSSDVSSTLTSIHHFNSKIIFVLVGLHLSAIAFYELYKQQRLVIPMLTGKKVLQTPPAEQPISLAREVTTSLATIALCAGAVYYLVNYV